MCVKRGGTKENTCSSLSFINISILVWFAHIQYMYYIIQYINNKYIFELASDTNIDNLSYKYLL